MARVESIGQPFTFNGDISIRVKNSRVGQYCKRITFDGVFFLAPLAVASLRQIKYTAKSAFYKVLINGFQSTTKSNPRQIAEN